MQPGQQAIQRGKAGAALEDTVELRSQCEATAFVGIDLVHLQIGVEVPDQLAHLLLESVRKVLRWITQFP